eukprot:4991355-Prymnesium_polylepis.2
MSALRGIAIRDVRSLGSGAGLGILRGFGSRCRCRSVLHTQLASDTDELTELWQSVISTFVEDHLLLSGARRFPVGSSTDRVSIL